MGLQALLRIQQGPFWESKCVCLLSVSVLLSLPVQSAMERQMRVLWRVLRCVFERHNHRFVVDCGKPSVVAIFLLPMPATAIFSMAYSSCAERTIAHAKYL